MPARLWALAICAALLSGAVAARGAEDLPRHQHSGYRTLQTVYGYRPYTPFVGPIKARYALDNYVYNPRVPGVDYSWGIGYFFGHGPGDRAYQSVPRP